MMYNVLTPHLITAIMGNQEDLMKSWSLVFNVIALIMAMGGVVFLVLGSAQNQHWEDQVYRNSLSRNTDAMVPDAAAMANEEDRHNGGTRDANSNSKSV